MLFENFPIFLEKKIQNNVTPLAATILGWKEILKHKSVWLCIFDYIYVCETKIQNRAIINSGARVH